RRGMPRCFNSGIRRAAGPGNLCVVNGGRAIEAPDLSNVVLAKARTHYPGCLLSGQAVATARFNKGDLWQLGLAFARTTWRDLSRPLLMRRRRRALHCDRLWCGLPGGLRGAVPAAGGGLDVDGVVGLRLGAKSLDRELGGGERLRVEALGDVVALA